MAFVYVLRCGDGSLYTGVAKDLTARLREHRAGRASRYTRAHLPVTLLWSREVATWGPGGTVGLVVGATAPEELRAIRALAPALPFLVPGVGAQGGSIEPVLVHGPVAVAAGTSRRPGGSLIVNVSRGIASAAVEEGAAGAPSDLQERVAAAARSWSERLPVLP